MQTGYADRVVKVVFATVALGMGVNLVGMNRVVHYGAPLSIEDYFQESGRAWEQAKSIIYWKPSDATSRKNVADPQNVEIAAVCTYIQITNTTECRTYQLLWYFYVNLVTKLITQRNIKMHARY